MSRKIKLIWDFKGRDSKKTAEHHCIHLKEFAVIKKITFYGIKTLSFSEIHHIAIMIVDEIDVEMLRKVLKPHRGQLAN